MQIRPLTSTGNASFAAISPDGKYVAYVDDQGSEKTLRVKQVATGSDVEIVGAGITWYSDVRFSNDGDYVYYVAQPEFDAQGELYQVPTLGGAPRKLLEGISTGVGFSPDGSRVVYLKGLGGGYGSEIWVSGLDGSDARRVASVEIQQLALSPFFAGGRLHHYICGLDAAGRSCGRFLLDGLGSSVCRLHCQNQRQGQCAISGRA